MHGKTTIKILVFIYGTEGNHENLIPAIMSLDLSLWRKNSAHSKLCVKKIRMFKKLS
jgi:hypothetical protein